eukprot:551058_1
MPTATSSKELQMLDFQITSNKNKVVKDTAKEYQTVQIAKDMSKIQPKHEATEETKHHGMVKYSNMTADKSFDYVHKNPSASPQMDNEEINDIKSDNGIVLHTKGHLKQTDLKPSAPEQAIIINSTVITDWSDNHIIEYWVNNLKLSQKWKQITIEAITKSGTT